MPSPEHTNATNVANFYKRIAESGMRVYKTTFYMHEGGKKNRVLSKYQPTYTIPEQNYDEFVEEINSRYLKLRHELEEKNGTIKQLKSGIRKYYLELKVKYEGRLPEKIAHSRTGKPS